MEEQRVVEAGAVAAVAGDGNLTALGVRAWQFVAWCVTRLRRWGCLGYHVWGDLQRGRNQLWVACERCGYRSAGWEWTPAYRLRLSSKLNLRKKRVRKNELARAFDAWHLEQRQETSETQGPARIARRERPRRSATVLALKKPACA